MALSLTQPSPPALPSLPDSVVVRESNGPLTSDGDGDGGMPMPLYLAQRAGGNFTDADDEEPEELDFND